MMPDNLDDGLEVPFRDEHPLISKPQAGVSYRCLCGAEFAPEETVTDLIATVEEHVRFDCTKVPRVAPQRKWPESPEAMTLADLESMAKRFGAAVATIKEAQALLGGSQGSQSSPVVTTSSAPTVTTGPRIAERPPSRLDPEAEAELMQFKQTQERARLVQQNRDDPSNFPPGIAQAMRGP